MNTKSRIPCVALVWLSSFAACLPAFAQGTAFTYQGQLHDNGVPANGIYDLRFTVYDSTNLPGNVVAGPLTNSATGVTNGLFTVNLDFGTGVFNGSARWLDIGVRTNGAPGFVTLTPRRLLTPTPYAITAEGVVSGGITSLMLASGSVTGDKIASGAVTSQKIDDGGAGVYQGLQFAELGLGGDPTLTFANLSPTTNGAAFSFTINSSAFGTVVGFTGFEGVSQPPYYTVEVRSPSSSVNPDTELGLPAQLTYTRGARATTFGGVITAFTLSGSDGTSYFYSVRIEPPLAYLALKADYRMYQSASVPSVATSVYQTVVGSPPSSSLTGSYIAHNSLTQYGETSLNFFSRLLENEGIFYFFNQSTAVPGIVLGDSTSAYLPSPNSPFAYYGDAKTNIPVAEFIRSFQKASHQSTLTSTVDSYNFTTPATSLLFSSDAPTGLQENYEFGNDIQTLAYDTKLATVRMHREMVEHSAISGSATAPDLRAGYTFTLSDLSGTGVGGSYVVTSVHHAGFVRVTNGVSTAFYGNQFQAIPATNIFRPARITPKPKALSTSAVVTGPMGEEIFPDPYGRVKVQFNWDRLGQNNEHSSGWLRVATPMASSNGRGMIFLPRIGDEVLVTFLEGDPDQPLVTGSLYNASRMPPYILPGNQQISTIRSTGTPGQAGAINEIMFDDTAGAQILSLRGAKDLSLSASNITISSPLSITGGMNIDQANLNNSGVASNALTFGAGSGEGIASKRTAGGNQFDLEFDTGFIQRMVILNNGNVGIGVFAPTNKLHVAGGVSATAFVSTSDRNAKENISPVSPQEVLARVAALPISTWNFKDLHDGRHMGPMAQDFYAAFGLGNSDRTITSVDPDGVALAAIQGLNQKLEARAMSLETELKQKEADITKFQQRLDALEKIIAATHSEKQP